MSDQRKEEYRQRLLGVLSYLDQLQTDADRILAGPGDVEVGAMAEELRELLVDMQANVEEKLDLLSSRSDDSSPS